MWDIFLKSITDRLIVTCTILAFVIPYSISKINTILHKYGDPSWKRDDTEKENNPHGW